MPRSKDTPETDSLEAAAAPEAEIGTDAPAVGTERRVQAQPALIHVLALTAEGAWQHIRSEIGVL